MGDDSQKRTSERRPVSWRVSLSCPDWKSASRVAAANASRGGIFLSTQRPPEVGAKVRLVIKLPDGSEFRAEGSVRHVITPEMALAKGSSPGVGIKLDPKHEIDLLLLEEMATSAGRTSSPATVEEGAAPLSFMPESESMGTLPPVSIPTSIVAPRKPGSGIAPAVGIDFGTTNTSISVAIGDRVYLIPDESGRTLQPSVVSYCQPGAPLVGWDARPMLVSEPRKTIGSSKRLLGRTFSDPAIGGYLHSAAYKTLAGPSDAILVDIEGNQLAIGQVCAAVFAHVREIAERHLGVPIKQTVVSVPVSFSDQQKAALQRAAQLGGLQVIDLVEEPLCGALAYGFGQDKNEIVAAYDFGGGTFDFTILDLSGERFRILASQGDSWLGGDDFDLVLAQHAADDFWGSTGIELRKRVVEWQRLVFACERAKRELSGSPQSTILVEGIVEAPKQMDLRQEISRVQFEQLAQDLFDRSIEICKTALQHAGLEPTDVTQVVATGGISHIPFIRNGLGRFFEREIKNLISPEEAICLGAGLQAARKVNHAVKGIARVEPPA